MTDAFERELIASNPFAGMESSTRGNRERDFFVTHEMATKVLDACPDREWRLLFAFSRYGGLRCPSEHLGVKVDDVDWERGRLRVTSPKTEHHDGKAYRWIPIFPELKPFLQECWEAAEPGQEYLITRYRSSNANLRTQLTKIIKRAGLEPWPKLFQNLRSTRQTELEESHPSHVVCAWIGNSRDVAKKHYLQVTDEHFERAASEVERAPFVASETLQPAANGNCVTEKTAISCGKLQCDTKMVGRTGLEPVT
ncbi:MAG: site-specific integrase, partial [Planctomycetales bacterium]|nr:site-specific integrase [Planctomycetales bacterium]